MKLFVFITLLLLFTEAYGTRLLLNAAAHESDGDVHSHADCSLPQHTPEEIAEEVRLRMELNIDNKRSNSDSTNLRRELGITRIGNSCPAIRPASDVPSRFGLDLTFYSKYVEAAGGVPVIGSSKVSDEAMLYTAMVFNQLVSGLPQEVAERLGDLKIRIAVMAKTEVTTNIPEHAFLKQDTTTNWDTRTRGIGADCRTRTGSAAEENALCWQGDVYFGENIVLHEMSHTIHEMGIQQLYPELFKDTVRQWCGRQQSLYTGLIYASRTWNEYFAKSAQAFFNANKLYYKGGSITNPDYFTRAQLLQRNSCEYKVMEKIFGSKDPGTQFICPAQYPVGSGQIDCTDYWKGAKKRTTPYNDNVKCIQIDTSCDVSYLGSELASDCLIDDFVNGNSGNQPTKNPTTSNIFDSTSPTSTPTRKPTKRPSTSSPTFIPPTTASPTTESPTTQNFYPGTTDAPVVQPTSTPTRKPTKKPSTRRPTLSPTVTQGTAEPTPIPTSPTRRPATPRPTALLYPGGTVMQYLGPVNALQYDFVSGVVFVPAFRTDTFKSLLCRTLSETLFNVLVVTDNCDEGILQIEEIKENQNQKTLEVVFSTSPTFQLKDVWKDDVDEAILISAKKLDIKIEKVYTPLSTQDTQTVGVTSLVLVLVIAIAATLYYRRRRNISNGAPKVADLARNSSSKGISNNPSASADPDISKNSDSSTSSNDEKVDLLLDAKANMKDSELNVQQPPPLRKSALHFKTRIAELAALSSSFESDTDETGKLLKHNTPTLSYSDKKSLSPSSAASNNMKQNDYDEKEDSGSYLEREQSNDSNSYELGKATGAAATSSSDIVIKIPKLKRDGSGSQWAAKSTENPKRLQRGSLMILPQSSKDDDAFGSPKKHLANKNNSL